ncbi:GroES-like protein [Myriangium duriaei CBS 260.36]|uniref:GroES-like protein n=1 Tax=Myriangium duriaei CBS 260.36 TaxID=1168546 RepID=A0A9P4J3Q7_9PEZI|nr:GroES-like protein [Myriangium duriaei CBS 260.36]
MALPPTMLALKSLTHDRTAIQFVPLPSLRPGYILVKVSHVALNPTDWKHRSWFPTPGATIGCDYSGTVVQVDRAVTAPFRPGERIAGFAHGTNKLQPEDGAFAEYAVVKGDTQMMVPEGLSDAEAATLGVGLTTVGQALYRSLKLPLPWEGGKEGQERPWVLVYGGSTATGSLAIQFARESGARVVSTCSPRNAEWVEGLGAERVFDYSKAEVGREIRGFTGGKLRLAFDCISEDESLAICADAFDPEVGGKISVLLPTDFEREKVDLQETRAYMSTGEDIDYFGLPLKKDLNEFEWLKEFWRRSTELFRDGKVKVHPLEVRKSGLEGISEGLDDLRDGKVSGVKLVYNVGATK